MAVKRKRVSPFHNETRDFNIKIKHLGPISNIDLTYNNPLTVFIGENNSGKSLLSYLLYGIHIIADFKHEYQLTKKFIDAGEKYIKPYILKYARGGTIHINVHEFVTKHHHHLGKLFSESLNSQSTKIFASSSILTDVEVTTGVSHFEKLKRLSFEGDFAGIDLYIKDGVLEAHYSKNKKNSKDPVVLRVGWYIIFSYFFYLNPPAFFLPAERSAINIFSKEIFREKSYQKDEIARKVLEGQNLDDIIKQAKNSGQYIARYPISIRDYLYFVDDLKAISTNKTAFEPIAEYIETHFINGKVTLGEFGEITYNTKTNDSVPLHVSSSLIKSLSGLVFYLRHSAQPGATIFIDEPELNLHPANQVKFGRLIARLIRAGLRLVISTHSDYIIREINNCVIANTLNSMGVNMDSDIAIPQEETINWKHLAVFNFNSFKIEKVEVTSKGFNAEAIDEVINTQNMVSQGLYYLVTEKDNFHDSKIK